MNSFKKIAVVFYCLMVASRFTAQGQVQGIVFDADSKQRLAHVYLYNINSHKGYYNNLKGEFTLPATKGDTLVAAVQGYRVDTTTIKAQNTVIIYLKRTSILLNTITIADSLLSPAERLRKNKEAYQDIYLKGNDKDLLKIGGTNGGGGTGLSIDALYSLFSREGKNARFLQQILERDYRESMIDFRFTKSMVVAATGLTEPDLADFMQQYRPSYYFIVNANDYALIGFIRSSFEKYVKNPKAYRLPKLVPGKM